MTPRPEECDVCGRLPAVGRPDVCERRECRLRGYERRGVEITVLRAQIADAGLALLDCAKERDEAQGALDALRAAAEQFEANATDAERRVREYGASGETRAQDVAEGRARTWRFCAAAVRALTPATLARAEGVGGKPTKEGT